MRTKQDTNQYLRRIIVGASATLAISAMAFAASAQAAVYSVIGTGGNGLNVRTAPSLGAGLVSNLRDGIAIDIVCQTRGDNVVASTMWDKIDQPVDGYVADYYTTTPVVNNPSPGLPTCGDSPPTTDTNTATNQNTSNSNSNTSARHSSGGQQVYFTVSGQSCGPLAGAVTVSGPNQYGESVTWTGSSSDGRSVFTRGWWWDGHVVIRFGRHAVGGYVPAAHDVTDGKTAGQVTITCSGTKYFPTYWRYNSLGGKVYLLLNNDLAFDPLFGKYISRSLTFGYWDGHFVYEFNDHVGVDINSGQLVIAQSTDHWSILGGAIAGGKVCSTGLSGAAAVPEVKAAIVAWCAVGGAAGAYIR
jgi:hypothetical protein